ncbi:MAG: Cof-type HAD-IIB family hydrolase [Erysipelotrichaceae bacterium]|nr:Cof-type HAD-IIB family hydrolase [Erysipelotrichaceae bacterium]
MKKYVFIDIDGTLFDAKRHEVPASALKALQMAKDNGHELFICTGRPKPVVESSYLSLPISGVVYAGGTHIELGNQIIYQGEFPAHRLDEIVNHMIENDMEFTLEGAQRNYYSDKCYLRFKEYFCSGADPDSEMNRRFEERTVICDFKDYKPEDASQVAKIDLFAKNDENIREYIDHLPEELEGFLYTETTDEIIEGEILIKGISKASGIDRVIEYFGAELKDTIAIGDSSNDLPMIRHAAMGIAMGNAGDLIKKEADFVTTSIDQDGLYNAFKEAGLI